MEMCDSEGVLDEERHAQGCIGRMMKGWAYDERRFVGVESRAILRIGSMA
jgi:hypothetical protein